MLRLLETCQGKSEDVSAPLMLKQDGFKLVFKVDFLFIKKKKEEEEEVDFLGFYVQIHLVYYSFCFEL